MNTKLIEMILFFTYNNPLTISELARKLSLADFIAFAYYGMSISGANYYRHLQGLFPLGFLSTVMEMMRSGLLDINIDSKEIIGNSCPTFNTFNKIGLSICKGILADNEENNWPFNFQAWLNSKNGEVVPYQTAWVVTERAITEANRKWGIGIVRRLGL